TRARVLAAVRELGYRPNLAARILITGRSQMLGVVSLDTTLYGPASTLHGIERTAREHDFAISVVTLPYLTRSSIRQAVERLRALRDAGRTVPADISVVGFDGLPESAFFLPPLTTIHQNFTALGHQAFHLLLARLHTPGTDHTDERHTIEPELIVRESSHPPP